MALVMIFVIPLCATAHDSTLPLCNSQPMTDIMGHDVPGLPPGPPPTTDAEACCTKCKSYTECVAFVYEPKQGHCYLKRSLGKTNHNPERLLSFVNDKCSCSAAKTPKCWTTPHPCNLAPSPGPAPPKPPNPNGPPSATFNRSVTPCIPRLVGFPPFICSEYDYNVTVRLAFLQHSSFIGPI